MCRRCMSAPHAVGRRERPHAAAAHSLRRSGSRRLGRRHRGARLRARLRLLHARGRRSGHGVRPQTDGTMETAEPRMTEAAPAAGAIDRLKLYYERNEQTVAIFSFICGFFFDILMVDRADSWHAIAQQVLYLAVIFAALTQMFLEEGKPQPDPASLLVG